MAAGLFLIGLDGRTTTRSSDIRRPGTCHTSYGVYGVRTLSLGSRNITQSNLRIRLAAGQAERGASAVEYGLLVALIAITIIVR